MLRQRALRQRAPGPCLLANLKRLYHRYLVDEQPGLMKRTGQRLEQVGLTEQSGHSSPKHNARPHLLGLSAQPCSDR